MNSIENRFAQGEYASLVREFIDSGTTPAAPRECAFLIGALIFVGRRADAECEYQKCAANDREAAIIARFFLGVGACRDSDYGRARSLFSLNFREREHASSDEIRFYAYQGFGFFRNLASRFIKSRVWAERAWRYAYACRAPFAMLLSLDLRGHCLIQLGEISQGLKCLEDARQMATTLRQTSVTQTLQVSITTFRARFGLAENAIQELESLIEKTQVTNTYSMAALIHELTRTLIIHGQVEEAKETLNRGLEETFRYGHRRQKATYLTRRSHIHWLQGEIEVARAKLTEALSLLEDGVDLLHQIEIFELKALIDGTAKDESELRRLKIQSGHAFNPHEDLIGSLSTRLRQNPLAVEPRIEALSRRWLGLLREGHRFQLTELVVDLLPNRLVVFDRGDVTVSATKVPETLKRILLILSQGCADKKRLTETVWGYAYDPLRHDSMIYSAIHRLRALMGRHNQLLRVNEEGSYGWSKPFSVRVIERKIHALSRATSATPVDFHEELNHRQLRTIEELGKGKIFTADIYAERFEVSKPTAVRDLTALVQKGLIQRTGRARATAYQSLSKEIL